MSDQSVIAWDLETVPDLKAAARMYGLEESDETKARDALGSGFPKIDQLKPQLITFNGNGFDLPVLRYRAMINRVSAPGLHARAYFNRYSNDAVDLCDVLGSFGASGKMKLDEISRILGLAGKPDGIDGGKVEAMIAAGKIDEVARYCETDVVNTYRLWLIYELFRGAMTPEQLGWSERQLRDYVRQSKPGNPHLQAAMDLLPP